MTVGTLRRLRWSLLQRVPLLRPRKFTAAARKRVLLLSEPGHIPQSQTFPFHFYQPELSARWQHELIELPTTAFEAAPERAPGNADIVCVQTWFNLAPARCDTLFQAIRARNPSARIVFLDSFAPTDLRLAEMLDPHIDLYVKKHVFKDRARYGQPTRGDTNLVDYYGRRYGLDYPNQCFTIPSGFLDKLVIGPSFCMAPRLLPQFFDQATARSLAPRFDIQARLAVQGDGWYQSMRGQAVDIIDSLDQYSVLSRNGIKQRQYMRELRASRLCFSPFGYGEVCWRDYEAILSGALLIKPDMSHIETAPDIFRANETYIPVAWDFSDLAEVMTWWLAHPEQCEKITRRAYQVLHEHARQAHFVDQMSPVFRD